MALVDMKSNLAAGAGKPLGSPEGRHDPNPDLKESNLDFGPPNQPQTNPGGRHLDGPVEPPMIVPDQKLSKLQRAVASAKTRGLSYMFQKAKHIPNPGGQFFGDDKWSGFVERIRPTADWEGEGILALDSRYDRENTGDYMSNFFTFQSPTGEIWPASSAQIGGKLLPAALISAVASETNLFLTDVFDNTHAFGFTRNMTETRFKGAGATYDPQNERNKMLSEIGTTTAMVSNLLNVGGFIKNFMGNMRNSPSKSNYAGIDENTMTYTPVQGVGYLHPTPGYLNPTTAFSTKGINFEGFLAGRDSFSQISNYSGIEGQEYTPPDDINSLQIGPGYGNQTSYFLSDNLLNWGFNKNITKQTNFAYISGDTYETPDLVSSLAKRTSKFSGGPKDGWKYHGFKSSKEDNDHAGMKSGPNVHHSTANKLSGGNWGDLVNLWGGTSLHGDEKKRSRRELNMGGKKNRLIKAANKVRTDAGLGPNDPGVVRGVIVDGVVQNSEVLGSPEAEGPKVEVTQVQPIDKNNHTLGNEPGVTKAALFPGDIYNNTDRPSAPAPNAEDPGPPTPKLLSIWKGDETLVPQANSGGSKFTNYSGGKDVIYNKFSIIRTDQWWGDSPFTTINLTGDDSQDKWDATGERVLSGPRAMQRAGERFAEFTKSPNFLIFEGKQLALNALNATAETRVYNPLSISSAFSSLARIKRHADLGTGTYATTLGSEFAPDGRNKEQSSYRGGLTSKTPDMKKVDPNRYAGAWNGANQLKLLGAQALTRSGMSKDKLKYTQDVSIAKNGISYENFNTPKDPYLQEHAVQDKMSEATLDPSKGGGFPKRLITPLNRKLTFSKDGKQEKRKKKSAIETVYEKFQKSPSSVSRGHSGFGTKADGTVKRKDGDKTSGKYYDTMDVLDKSLKPSNDGSPHMPEGGYEKEGLFKGVSNTVQPGKYKTNLRIDGGRGFASSAAPGTKKKDLYASGKADSRGNETKDEINVVPYQEPGKTPWENKDFVPFKILDKYNNKQIVFRAAFKSITESVTPTWNPIEYVGRPDSVHVYKGATRNLNITFTIYPYTYKEFKVLWAKVNYLSGLTLPSYEKIAGGGERMVPPMLDLTVGDLYTKMPGFINSLTHEFGVNDGWEIKNKERLPKKIDVTMDYMVIGKKQWKRDGDLYGFNAKKFNKA